MLIRRRGHDGFADQTALGRMTACAAVTIDSIEMLALPTLQ